MKKAFKSMSVYGLGGILSRFIQFLLLPLYTRVLLPSDYGSLEIVSMTGSIIAILFGLMISSGYVRNYYDNKDNHYRTELFSSAIWFTFFFSAVFLVLFFFLSDNIAARMFNFENGALYLKLILVSSFITVHNQIFYNLLMVQDKARKYVTINVITLLISIVCTIVFVVYFKWSIKGILLAQIIGFGLEFVLLFSSLSEKNLLFFSFEKIKEMLKYSLPLIPLQIASFILELSDRYFLKEYQTLNDVGLYSLGYRFAAIIPLFAVQPMRGFTPYIFSLINTPEKCKQTLADFFRYYLAAILFISLVISMFSREAIMVMADKSYYTSWKVVYILCISYVFYGSVNLLSYAIEIVKKNWISGIFWLFAAAINIGLNFILIPRYGILGASIATTISYFIVLLCYFFAVSRVYYVPFQYGKFLFILALTSIFYYFSTWLNTELILSVILKSLLLGIYTVIVLFNSYFTRDELAGFKRFCFDLVKR